jgi:hypothetical protein
MSAQVIMVVLMFDERLVRSGGRWRLTLELGYEDGPSVGALRVKQGRMACTKSHTVPEQGIVLSWSKQIVVVLEKSRSCCGEQIF